MVVARGASADEPVYPTVYPDRPILPLPGMTDLEIGLTFPHFDDARLYATVGHRYGPVYLAFGGPGLQARLDTGSVPAVITVGLVPGLRGTDGRYFYAEYLALDHKVHLRPGLAVFADIGVSLHELNSNSIGRIPPSHSAFMYGEVELEDQIAERIAIDALVGVSTPVAESFTQQDHTVVDARLEVIGELDTWDAYASIAVNDTTSDPYLEGEIGFKKRWGARAAPRTPR